MRILGVVLVVLGLVGLLYGGLQWTRQEKVVDVGPVKVTHDKTESIPIPPVAGAVCLIAGAIVLAANGRHV
jgi:hypothetical protein